MNENHCEGCPGPEVLKIWHENMVYKIASICDWRKDMEEDLAEYRDKREHQEREYKKEMDAYREKRQDEEFQYRKEVDQKFSTLKNWAIANLTALTLILLAQVIGIIRQ